MTLRDACGLYMIRPRAPTGWAPTLSAWRPPPQPDLIARLAAWQGAPPHRLPDYCVRPITVRGQPWHLPDDGED